MLIDNNTDGTYDSSEVYDIDIYGRTIMTYIDSDNNSETGHAAESQMGELQGIDVINGLGRDSLGNIIQRTYDLDGNGSIDRVAYYEVDSLGRALKAYIDLDNSETTGETRIVNDEEVKGIDEIHNYTLDVFGKQSGIYYDRSISGGVNEKHYITRDLWGNEITRYSDMDDNSETGYSYEVNDIDVRGIDRIRYYQRDVNGSTLETYIDTNGDGNFNSFTFAHVNRELDITAWSSEKLADFGNRLSVMTLSNETASTAITLDKATIAAISQSGFRIGGDATDTVTLTDVTKAEKLDATRTISRQVYDQYQFEVEGDTYTLLVDSDINVVLG